MIWNAAIGIALLCAVTFQRCDAPEDAGKQAITELRDQFAAAEQRVGRTRIEYVVTQGFVDDGASVFDEAATDLFPPLKYEADATGMRPHRCALALDNDAFLFDVRRVDPDDGLESSRFEETLYFDGKEGLGILSGIDPDRRVQARLTPGVPIGISSVGSMPRCRIDHAVYRPFNGLKVSETLAQLLDPSLDRFFIDFTNGKPRSRFEISADGPTRTVLKCVSFQKQTVNVGGRDRIGYSPGLFRLVVENATRRPLRVDQIQSATNDLKGPSRESSFFTWDDNVALFPKRILTVFPRGDGNRRQAAEIIVVGVDRDAPPVARPAIPGGAMMHDLVRNKKYRLEGEKGQEAPRTP